MTTQVQGQRTAARPRTSASGDVPRSLPRAPQRYGQWAATVLFVIVMALAAGYLYMAKGATTEVLVLDRAVAAGQEIKEADLGSAQVSGVDDAVPVADLDEVLGQRSAVALVPGQVLTSGALSTEPVPGPDERVVAIRLEAGRVPATLKAGAVVTVLAVPPTGDAGQLDELDTPQPVTEGAAVYAVETAVDGSVVISLLVSDADADKVAAYSAAGRVTVVQESVVQAPVAGE